VIRPSTRLALALLVTLTFASSAFAQDDDRALKPAEPDFTVVNLPTSLNLPQWGSGIRITHRFLRPLDCDLCENSFLGDALGTDQGAAIGLEYRIGIVPRGQVILNRARMDRTIQFMGEYGVLRQTGKSPVEMAAIVSIEGTENFQDVYSPTIGVALSHLFGDRAALHLDPMWVGNSNIASDVGDDNTFVIGIGGRFAIVPGLNIVAEVSPRAGGYSPGNPLAAFALEKRLGGHMFQLVFSNNFGTTLRQIAQGAPDSNEWYMGFNLTRKFF